MELEWIVGKALAKDRERRYQSGVELIVDLERLTTKLRAGGSRVALTPSHGIAEPRRPEGQHATWPVEPASGDPVSVEQAQVLRKRQVRELVLDLGSQGVLPDRLLSQALEVISLRPDESSDESSEAERNRNRLLDDLLDGRVRVGEFIEQWHHSESEKQALAIDSPEKKKAAKKKRKSYDVRSQAEIFGIPLFHNASGKDPATGKERIATGVFAFGNISVGLVACGRWIAIGGITVSPVSIGLWAFGLIAIGLHAVGMFELSVSQLPIWQALLIAIGAALVGGFLFNRHKVRGPAGGDSLHELALFSRREWRDLRTSFRGGRVMAIAGRYVVDLTEIQPAAQEIVMEANAVMGAVRIRVPDGWQVMVNGTPILGRFADQRPRRPEQDSAGQRLVVGGRAILGSVTVES